jgi:hypothetical protein
MNGNDGKKPFTFYFYIYLVKMICSEKVSLLKM